MAKVTVLLPCKNAERTIQAAVDSVLNQTFRDFELIVIDDDSTDKTASILEGYRDPRMRVLRPKVRLGLVGAIYTGMHASVGEYIARIDADDVSLPNRLSVEASYLDTHHEVGMVAGQAFFKYQGRVYPSPFSDKLRTPRVINGSLIDVNPIVASASMIRKSKLIEAGGYNEFFAKWPYAEDYDLAIRMAALCEVVLIPDYVCVYSVSDSNSITAGPALPKFISLFKAKMRAAKSPRAGPVEATHAFLSVIRSVGLDLVGRLTRDRLLTYFLNMETLRSKL